MQVVMESYPVPPGKIASVVTFLEMTAPPPPVSIDPDRDFERVTDCDLDWYREFFRTVGADWLWHSRLLMTDEELRGILDDPATHFYVLREHGTAVGFFELDRRRPPEIEIRFFGLAPQWVGRGLGAILMAKALQVAWSYQPRRVFLHTCTLDHPRAVPFYTSWGFRVCGREIEFHDDPRLTGVLPRTAAPHAPIAE